MTNTYRRGELTIDQQLALATAARRLGEELTGAFGAQTIERFLHTSYEEFAPRAAVANFLPLLAERFARQRLHALARVEGRSDGRPIVLFLCTHNAGRSQMALGWFRHLVGEHAIAWSGGAEFAGEINPAAVASMAERGIDISGESPKPWTEEIVRAADVVVTMGCGTPARSTPAGGTWTGSSTIRPARASRTSARSVTRSSAVCAPCSPISASPPSDRRPTYRA
ncbi:three-helix bundle dimerization domain-containing protein [Streptosporangium canum]|uniref:arsenate reductase/protein-tyrosine-phosphatase family protein n=1 Tax=Streptosporangium canum TaxID=324952 RepID=UPI0036D109C5